MNLKDVSLKSIKNVLYENQLFAHKKNRKVKTRKNIRNILEFAKKHII